MAGLGGLFMVWFIGRNCTRADQLSHVMGNVGIIGLFISGAVILMALFYPLIHDGGLTR